MPDMIWETEGETTAAFDNIPAGATLSFRYTITPKSAGPTSLQQVTVKYRPIPGDGKEQVRRGGAGSSWLPADSFWVAARCAEGLRGRLVKWGGSAAMRERAGGAGARAEEAQMFGISAARGRKACSLQQPACNVGPPTPLALTLRLLLQHISGVGVPLAGTLSNCCCCRRCLQYTAVPPTTFYVLTFGIYSQIKALEYVSPGNSCSPVAQPRRRFLLHSRLCGKGGLLLKDRAPPAAVTADHPPLLAIAPPCSPSAAPQGKKLSLGYLTTTAEWLRFIYVFGGSLAIFFGLKIYRGVKGELADESARC